MKDLIKIRNKMLAEVEQIEGNEMLKVSLKFTINELDTWIYKKSQEEVNPK